MPRNDNFFDFFERHVVVIMRASELLLEFKTVKQSPDRIFEKIKDLEKEGDQITQQCMEALHKTFITPFDRMDIHRLMSALDDILDEIEDIARYIILYKLQPLTEHANRLIELIVKGAQEMQCCILELRKMKNTEEMRKHFKNIATLESKADEILSEAIIHLFEEEKDTRMVIKWKEVYEHLECATDVCDDVANLLEGILLENE